MVTMEGPILSLCDVQTYLNKSVATSFHFHLCKCAPDLLPKLPELPELPDFFEPPSEVPCTDENETIQRCASVLPSSSSSSGVIVACVVMTLVLVLSLCGILLVKRTCKKEAVFLTFIVGGRKSSMRRPLLRISRIESTKSNNEAPYQDLTVAVETHSRHAEYQELTDRTPGT